MLAEKGVDLDSKDNKGRTQLLPAVELGHEPAVELLVKKGADLNFVHQKGRTPLCLAAFQGHVAMVKPADQGGRMSRFIRRVTVEHHCHGQQSRDTKP